MVYWYTILYRRIIVGIWFYYHLKRYILSKYNKTSSLYSIFVIEMEQSSNNRYPKSVQVDFRKVEVSVQSLFFYEI